jgi:hypothetical protein
MYNRFGEHWNDREELLNELDKPGILLIILINRTEIYKV